MSADRLCLIALAADYDRVHYALSMASCAAAVGRPVTLFFTMGAIRALQNDDAGAPGWTRLLPAGNGQSAAERDTAHAEGGIATLEELLAACAELEEVTVMVCEMGLKAEGLTAADLRDDIAVSPGGLATLYADAKDGGQIVVV